MSLPGKLMYTSTTLQIATFDSRGNPVSLLKIDTARIQQIVLPLANAGSTAPALVRITLAQAAGAMGKPSTWPQANPLGQVLHQGDFRLHFDSLDATTAMSIAPMTLVPSQMVKGYMPQLVLTTMGTSTTASAQAWSKGLQSWFDSQTAKNGTLTFYTSNFSTALFVVRFSGVRVKSIGGTTTNPIVTFTVTGISIPTTLTM